MCSVWIIQECWVNPLLHTRRALSCHSRLSTYMTSLERLLPTNHSELPSLTSYHFAVVSFHHCSSACHIFSCLFMIYLFLLECKFFKSRNFVDHVVPQMPKAENGKEPALNKYIYFYEWRNLDKNVLIYNIISSFKL